MIPAVRGIEGPAKTRMDLCGSTFRRAPTSLATTGGKFSLLPRHSTVGLARHSGGEHRRKCLPANYTQFHDTVLRRPVERALRPGVRMMNQLTNLHLIAVVATLPQSRPQWLGDKTHFNIRRGMSGHDPADGYIDDEHHVKPALRGTALYR